MAKRVFTDPEIIAAIRQKDAVRTCGYCVTRHATICHLNGRWIFAAGRVLQPLGLDVAAIRYVVALDPALRASSLFRDRGSVHLVLAQDP